MLEEHNKYTADLPLGRLTIIFLFGEIYFELFSVRTRSMHVIYTHVKLRERGGGGGGGGHQRQGTNA